MKELAQESLGRIGGGGLGPFGNIALDAEQGLVAVTNVVSGIIGIMTVAGGIWFMFQLLTGSLSWITSGGDKNKLQEARNRITNAFIGLIIVVAGWSIIALTGEFLDFDILVGKPGDIMRNLFPGN